MSKKFVCLGIFASWLLLSTLDLCRSEKHEKTSDSDVIPVSCQGDYKVLRLLSVRSRDENDIPAAHDETNFRISIRGSTISHADPKGRLLHRDQVTRLANGQLQISGVCEMHFTDRPPEKFPVVTTDISLSSVSDQVTILIIRWDREAKALNSATIYPNDLCWILERVTAKDKRAHPGNNGQTANKEPREIES